MKVKASYNRALSILVWVGLLAGALFFGVLLIADLRAIPQACDAATCRQTSGTRIAEDIVALVGLFVAQGAWRLRWERAAWANRQREAATRGVGRTLALKDELRTEDPQPLTPPVTLAHRMAWSSGANVTAFGLLLALTQLGFAGLLLSETHDGRSVSLTEAIVVEGILIGFLALFFLSLYITWRQRVEISEDGLTVRRFGRDRSIRWSDARLFARVGVATYELSGEASVVRWVRARDTTAFRPTIPFADYQRQMDGLLLLVDERTHLPLYDLADTR